MLVDPSVYRISRSAMLYLLYHRFIMSRKIRPVVTIAMIYCITSRGDMEEGEHQRCRDGRIIDTPAVGFSQLYPRANSVREKSPDEQQCCRRSQTRCGIACAHSLGHRESVYAVEMGISALMGPSKPTIRQPVRYGALKLLHWKRIPQTPKLPVKICGMVQGIHEGRLGITIMLRAWCDGCLFQSHGSK